MGCAKYCFSSRPWVVLYKMACFMQDVFLCSVIDSPAPVSVTWNVTTWAVKMRNCAFLFFFFFFQLMQIWLDSLHNDKAKQHVSHGFCLWFWIADIVTALALFCSLDSGLLCSFGSYCVLSGLNNEGQNTDFFQGPLWFVVSVPDIQKCLLTHALLTVAQCNLKVPVLFYKINKFKHLNMLHLTWIIQHVLLKRGVLHQVLFLKYLLIFWIY